jgi:formate hydrogenlyase transcriptional activator
MRSQSAGIALTNNGLSAEQVEELLRFARTLDAHSDPEQLIRSLPNELGGLVESNTAALILSDEIALSGYVVDKGVLPITPEPPRESSQNESWQRQAWRDEICQTISEQPIVLSLDSSFDQEVKFNQAAKFFRERGNHSLCVLPLPTAVRPLGALCFARAARNAFSNNEIDLLCLIAEYVALAIDDRLNFAHSETVQSQLESERKKLQLILDLNNSVVSNLELREVLRSVSPGIRKIMHLDRVALILPDAVNKHLELYELDFPNGKYQNISKQL